MSSQSDLLRFPHSPTQFLDKEENGDNRRLPSGLRLSFTKMWSWIFPSIETLLTRVYLLFPELIFFIILSAIRRELVIFYFTSIQLVWMYRLVKNFCLQQVSTCYRRIDLNDSQFVRLPLKLLRILLSVSEWRTCKYSITCKELLLNCPASLHKLRWTATCKWNSQLFL